MYGNGWPGSTASGVSTGKISSRNRSPERLVVLGDRRVLDELDARRGQALAELEIDRRLVGDELEDAGPGRRQLLGRRSGRPATAPSDPAATCWRRPLIRIWKNSSSIDGEDRHEPDPLEERRSRVGASWRTRLLYSSHDSSRLR